MSNQTTTPATEPKNPLAELYASDEFNFKRPFPFNKALAVVVSVTLADTAKGGKYLRAVYTDTEGSELIMPYNLTLEGVQYNRDFFNLVLQSNAPAEMKEHTLKSEQMLLFIPRLFALIEKVNFEVVAVAKFNKEKESKRVWIFDSISSAEDYLESRKKSKGVPVKETKESQERKDVQSSALNSLL